MLSIPPIYPITDTRISGLTHLEQVKRLAQGGATLIQLREKNAGAREFYDAAVECIAFARPRDVRIVINDRVDIALAARADGVHLGQEDMPPPAARELLGPEAVIGYSTHSLEQAARAKEMSVDYIAIGPVFATSTKEDADPVVGLEGVRAAKASIGNIPLVAIGGIEDSTLRSVLAAGADIVAIIGAILGRPHQISHTTRELLDAASVKH